MHTPSAFKLEKSGLLLLLIILLAAFLRLHSIAYTEFKYDEADAVYRTMYFLKMGGIPTTALATSIRVDPPAVITYLLMPIVYVSHNPASISGYVAFFNIASVFLCYLLVRKFSNERTALIASLLYAVNPWAVIYSRKIWPQEFMPAFTILFFYSLSEWAINKKPKFISLAIFLFSCAWPLHLTATVFLLFFPLMWIIFRPPLDVKYVILGLGLTAALLSPYVYHEYSTGLPDYHKFIEYLSRPNIYQRSSFFLPLEMASTFGFQYFLGDDYIEFKGRTPQNIYINSLLVASFLAGLLCIAGINISGLKPGVFIHKAQTNPHSLPTSMLGSSALYRIDKAQKFKAVVFLWVFIPCVALIFSKTLLAPHYYILLFPAQFIVIGMFVDGLMSSLPKLHQNLVLLALIIAVTYLAGFTLQFQNFVAEKTVINGDYGVPLEYKIDHVKELVNDKNITDVREVSGGLEYQYLLEYGIRDNQDKPRYYYP